MAEKDYDETVFDVKESKDKGQGVYSRKPFKKYDLLWQERATIAIVTREHLTTYCSYCMRRSPKFGLKKCANCKVLHYCSEKCLRKDWELHKAECTIFNLLPNVPLPLMRLYLRLLLSIKVNSEILDELLSLSSNSELISNDLRVHFVMWIRLLYSTAPSCLPTNIEEDALLRLYGMLALNAFSPENELGVVPGLYFFHRASRLNHSCMPNAIYSCSGRHMRILALAEIKAGDELCISYVNRFAPKVERSESLSSHYFFSCSCPRCIKEAPMSLESACSPSDSVLNRLRGLNCSEDPELFVYHASSMCPELLQELERENVEVAKAVLKSFLDSNNSFRVTIPDLDKLIAIYNVSRLAAFLTSSPKLPALERKWLDCLNTLYGEQTVAHFMANDG